MINKGFVGTLANVCSGVVTTVTLTSIYRPFKKNGSVAVQSGADGEHAVTSVTVPKILKKPSKYKGLSGNKTVLPKISSLLRSVTERRAI